MKKKLAKVLLLSAVASLCVVGFSACGEKHDALPNIDSDCSYKENMDNSYTEDLEYDLSFGRDCYICNGIGLSMDENIVIANSYKSKPVTSIGSDSFSNCSSLTSVTIGNSVTSIGDSAFRGCSSLTSITIPESVTNIGNNAFAYCTNLQYNEYDNAYYLGNDNNPYLVLIKAKSISITSCQINEKTRIIYYSAFYNCSSLTSITIPNSVTSIGSDSFYNCSSLTSVTIGNSVTSIGNSAFIGCSSLTSVTIGNSVTSIGGSAFSGCSSLKIVKIPNSVTNIGSSAFHNCSSLYGVSIGNGVTSIGDSAFAYCSALKIIMFNNTKIQWCSIIKGENWKYNLPSDCKVHCTDGDLSI